MFFRRGNKVLVDYIETNKESKEGIIEEFNDKGIVISVEENESSKTVFVPLTSISEVVLLESVEDSAVRVTNFHGGEF